MLRRRPGGRVVPSGLRTRGLVSLLWFLERGAMLRIRIRQVSVVRTPRRFITTAGCRPGLAFGGRVSAGHPPSPMRHDERWLRGAELSPAT